MEGFGIDGEPSSSSGVSRDLVLPTGHEPRKYMGKSQGYDWKGRNECDTKDLAASLSYQSCYSFALTNFESK
jgi:hypothetical protein